MSAPSLTVRERDLIYHIGRSVILPGRIFPPFSRDVVDKIEKYLSEAEPPMRRMFRSFLFMLDKGAYTRYMRPFLSLSDERKRRFIEGWAKADIARRTVLRVVMIVIKVAYYSDEGIYEQLGIDYRKPEVKDEPVRWMTQVMPGEDIREDLDLEAEVVVVGTGAGGAAVAAELAEKGNAVVMIEQGDYFRRSSFTGRAMDMQKLLYLKSGQTMTFGNTSILVPVGKTVGGTTTINSGTCFRTPRRTLRRWREQYGLSEFTVKMMEPYFERVEAVYKVTTADMKYVGANGEIIARGAEKLGYRHGPLPRNAPDCDGQGVCCFGCPTDAKRSTNISYVPRALQASALLVAGTRIDEILFEGNRAIGVAGYSSKTGKKVRVRAPIVVYAGGTFATPLMLMSHEIGNSSGNLGKNLSIHPAGGLMALMNESVNGWKTIPQGYMVDEFKEEGIVLEGVGLPLELAAAVSACTGRRLQNQMENFDRLASFGFMIEDSSRGKVRPGPGSSPLITYNLNRQDRCTLLRSIEILTRIFLAAGAQEIYPPVFGWDPITSEAALAHNLTKKVRAWDLDITAYHPLGTCHMGGNPKEHVCDPNGELYDAQNLFICDGSVVPPALGVNPQITISALATRMADFIADRLDRIG